MELDQKKLNERIGRLEAGKASAFAACVAQRFIPSFTETAYAGATRDVQFTKETLALIWQWALDQNPDLEQAHFRLDQSKRIAKLLSAAEGNLAKYAEDAVTALAYALCAYLHTPDQAGWAAQCGYEAADYFVNQESGIDYERDGEAAVLAHPVVQREISRQNDDLILLESSPGKELERRGLIESLRLRAIEQSHSVFDN